MEHFKWMPKMSVGLPVIDAQHKRFFELLNNVEDALVKGQGQEIVDNTLRELINYMQIHFQAEEDFMKERFFTGYPEHREAHQVFSDHVRELMRKYRAGDGVDAAEIRHFMVDWLAKHIMDCDQQYAKFIIKRKKHQHPM